MSRLKKYNEFINTRVGFFSLLIGLLWLKNMFAYVVDFHLSIQNPMQLFILDLFALPVLLFKKKIIVEEKHPRFRKAAALSALSLLICSGNIFLAEIDRSGLLSRQFSREYLVKYLGVNAFTVYDSYQTFQNNQIRAEASPNDLKEVKSYIREHYASSNF